MVLEVRLFFFEIRDSTSLKSELSVLLSHHELAESLTDEGIVGRKGKTSTVNVLTAELPEGSLPAHITAVLPTGNREFDEGKHTGLLRPATSPLGSV